MMKSILIASLFVAAVSAQAFGTANCTAFCTSVTTTCGAIGSGYYSLAGCQGWCSTLVNAGFAGNVTDTTGNTMGCRAYHAGVASFNATMAAIHCVHAGPLGGAVCVDGTDPAGLAAHCAGVAGACPGAYTNATVCAQTLGAAAAASLFNPTIGQNYTADGNSAVCRTTHIGAVFDGGNNAASRALHCPHGSALGGLVCGNVTTAATLFCGLAQATCAATSATFPYTDAAACATAAAAFPDNANIGTSYGSVSASGNSISCRAAQLLATGCTAAIGPTSTVCVSATTPPANADGGAASQLSVALFALLAALALAMF